MLKLDEEPPQALAVVRWGRDLVLEAPQGRAVVMWERALVWEVPQALAGGRWGRDLVMEAPGWPLPHGVMCTPAQGFLDLAGLDSSIEFQPIGILPRPPPNLQADNPLKSAPARGARLLGAGIIMGLTESQKEMLQAHRSLISPRSVDFHRERHHG